MNEALQQLETKVENQGATPQGKVSAVEWNVLVAAVKALDSAGINDESLKKYLQQYQYITRPELSGILEDATPDLSGVVTTSGEQDIFGIKNFVNGLKLSNKLIRYDADKNVFIFPGNILAEGGMAWNTKLEGFEERTITAAVQVDWKTIGKNDNGELCVIGGTGDSPGSGGVVGGVTIDEVKNYLTNEGYATQVWVNEQGFLKSITSSMVTSALGYTPFNADNFTKTNIKSTLGISDWALESVKPAYKFSEITNTPTTLSGYGITDAYTKAETNSAIDTRVNALVNGAPAAYDTLKEIADVLAGNVNSIGDIVTALGTKWTQDDSLIANWNSAYSWGNHASAGYAKQSDITSEFSKYVTLSTAQTITGIKDFVNGLKIGGTSVTYNASKNAFVFPANAIFEGGIAWNSKLDGFDIPTIMDAVIVDGDTIVKENGKLKVNGDVSGGINETQLGNYLTRNNYAKKSDIPSLSGYATQVWVNEQGFLKSITSAMVITALGYTPYNAANFTKANIKSTLGISDWALESVKPTYTASEVGALGVNDTAANANKLDGVEISSMFKYYGFNTDLSIFKGGNYQTTTHYINSTDTTITNAPTYYGTAVNFGARVGNFQLFASNTHKLYFRQRWTSDWGDWKQIAFTSDIPTNLSQFTDDVVKGRYLSTSGGTVNGGITATGNVSAQSVIVNRGITAGSVLSFVDTDASEKIVLQRNSGGDILFCGGFADRNVYIDGSILRVRTENTIFSRGISTTGVTLSSGGKSAVISYNASKNAFIFPANAIFEGGVAWNSPMDGTSAYASELERRIEALQTEVDTLKQTVQTLTA